MTASSGQDDTLVIICRDGYHATIWTCDHTHGLSDPFQVHSAVLERALQNDPPSFYRSDSNYLTMCRQDDRLQCSIVWLTGNSGALSGYEQSFGLPVYDVEAIADGSAHWLISFRSPHTGQEATLTRY